ncbi:hypothetical protein F0562_030885 [Nyssa sinensis]|uniref:HMA domain-containing protein n=1 Tax=Nyssa sinensis TaxID=561372 RepID=A0A5J5B1Z0_9ASTE|nr:hypothetical protein F0562_030885 [Nyssa sinensis]
MEVNELKVHLHCKACEKAVRKALCKIKGVTCVEIDVKLSRISVLGYADCKMLIKAIRKTGRRAEVWPSKLLGRQGGELRCGHHHGFGCIIPKWLF